MKTKLQMFLSIIVVMCLIGSSTMVWGQAAIGDFRSHGTGTWATLATWDRYDGGTWVNPAPNAPTSTDGVITILSGHNVTVGAAVTADQIVVASGGTLTITARLTIANGTGTDLDVLGTIDDQYANSTSISISASATCIIESGGVLKMNGTSSTDIGGSGSGGLSIASGGKVQLSAAGVKVPIATWDANSTCEVTGYTSGTSLSGTLTQTFGNFTWNCASGSATCQMGLASNTTSFAGNFIVTNSGTGKVRFTSTTGTTIAIGGNFVVQGGTIEGTGSSSVNFTVNVSGSVLVSSGKLDLGASSGTTTVNVNGDVSVTGTGIFQAGSTSRIGNVNFSGTGIQTFTSGGSLSPSGTGTINWTVNNGATVNLGSNILGGTATTSFTLSSGGKIQIGSAAGITSSGATGNIQTTTRTLNTGANYEYNGSSAQVTGNGLPSTVNNLTINNSSSGVSLSGSSTVNGTLTLTSGTFTIAANTLTLTNPIGGTASNLSADATSSLGIAGSVAGINIPSNVSALNNLTLNNSNGTTLQGPLTINGTLTMTSGALNLNSNTLAYGASGIIGYNGGSAQITGAELLSTVPNLTFNNASGVALNTATSVTGTLTLSSGALNNGANLTLGNGATISRATGTVAAVPTFGASVNIAYTGSTLCTTGLEIPAGASVLNNLTINNSAGVTLSGAASVNGALTLTSGLLTTTSSNIVTLGTAATVSGGSTTSFVNGPIASLGTGNQTYPVGKGSAYRPVTLGTIVGTSPVISVEVFNGPSGGTTGTGLNNISTTRYWAVVLASGLFTSSTVNLTYGSGDQVTDSTNLVVATQTSSGANGTYNSIAGVAYGNGTGNITSNSISSLGSSSTPSFFVLGNLLGGTNPLPVEMTSFTAVAKGISALLQWSTATEVNNSGFEIQRRAANTTTFAKVGFVNGAGTSNSPKEYTYQDANLAPGVYVYRIKQIDNSGAFKYSATTQIDAGIAQGFELLSNYPNPFNPSTNLQFSVPQDGHATLKVYNTLGQEVATLFDGMAVAGHYIPAKFDGSRYASGVYFSRLEYNGKNIVQRMVMMK